MVFRIYKRAFAELMKKPFRLWGITLLSTLFSCLGYWLGGPVIAIGLGVTILFQASLANIYLKSYIGSEKPRVVDLFTTFRDWKTIKRVICSIAWGELWKTLWLLIPFAGIVFYIIKTYEYGLIPYIVMDQPETGITECKEVSSKMTNGYKGKMFLADLLVPVAIFVTMFILGLLSSIPYVGVFFAVIMVLTYIVLLLVVGLFMNIVHASFYEEIKNAPVVNQYPPQSNQFAPQGNPYIPQQGAPYAAPQQAAPYAAPQQAAPYAAPQQTAPYAAPQQAAPYAAPQQAAPYAAPQQAAPYAAPQQAAPYAAPQQGAPYTPPQGGQIPPYQQ